MPSTIDLKSAIEEFNHLKTRDQSRNYEYYLLRQAVMGNFRWPRDWPKHISKIKKNLCKPIVEHHATYLMGKGFSYNVERPNTLEYRDAAERTEKILRRCLELSKADEQFDMAAKTGSMLGRTVFKVYKKGKAGAQHACFTYCQPDYFYGVPSGDNYLSEWSTVYYSYPMDILEARRVFGDHPYKSEVELSRENYYTPLLENQGYQGRDRQRRIPVLEVWTKDAYALVAGGVTVYNGENPYKWKATAEGFVPFVVIENIRNGGEAIGEADIAQVRELNEELNQLLSRKSYIVKRYLQPTLVWEGAPQNYAEILAATIGGGGAIPARLGSRLYFLAYDRPLAAVQEMEQTLRQAILETAGTNEQALSGQFGGSVNTGPALQAQFQPVLSTIEKKRKGWESGLKSLFAMLLELQEQVGASKALGMAVVGQTVKSANYGDGELVSLSGKDIQGLREVTISWPGILPKDDFEASRLEMEKASQGFQSIYTTLEKLGEEYPDDEISRIRMENEDPSLRGEKVAEQMRAQAPLLRAQAQAEQLQQQGGGQPPEDIPPPQAPDESSLLAQGDLGARLREANRRSPSLNTEGDYPVVEAG